MRRVLVIGIGAGDPDHLTVQAIKALNQVDVFFVVDKGDDDQDLVRLRQADLRALRRATRRTGSWRSATRSATATAAAYAPGGRGLAPAAGRAVGGG